MRTRVGDYIDKVIKENSEAEAAALNSSENKEVGISGELNVF